MQVAGSGALVVMVVLVAGCSVAGDHSMPATLTLPSSARGAGKLIDSSLMASLAKDEAHGRANPGYSNAESKSGQRRASHHRRL
jgi:hypothetical protein